MEALPAVRRRGTGLGVGAGAAHEEEGTAGLAWFEGDFDPFTIWLDAAGSSPEAGGNQPHRRAPA